MFAACWANAEMLSAERWAVRKRKKRAARHSKNRPWPCDGRFLLVFSARSYVNCNTYAVSSPKGNGDDAGRFCAGSARSWNLGGSARFLRDDVLNQA